MRVRILSLCCSLAVASMAGPVAAPSAAAQSPSAAGRTADAAIAAMPLKEALELFTAQTGLRFAYAAQLVDGVRSAGAPAGLSPEAKLQKLLEGTGLGYRYLSANTITLVAAGSGREGVAPAPARQGERQAASGDRQAVDLPSIQVRRPFTDANVDIVRTESDAQPYYIFGNEEIERSNTVNVEDFLKQRLTMNTVAATPTQQQGGIRLSSSLVNLRGLGTEQTLILVNGRRVAGATSNGSLSEQFDLNSFSPAMIERIEVLPTSASAIYGGSAMGGVINIILRRDFTGGDLGVTYDTPLDHHAPIRTINGSYGFSLEDGRTHVTVSAAYRDGESLLFGERPELIQRGLSRIAARAPGLLYSAAFPFSEGSTTNIASANGSELVLKDGTRLGSSLTYVPAGTSPTTSAAELAAGLLANAGLQNTTMPATRALTTGLLSPFTGNLRTKSIAGAIRRKMTDRFELIGEVFYNSNESRNELGAPLVAIGAVIPAGRPENPFLNDVRVGVPVADFGINRSQAESLRMVAGFVADLAHDWRAQGDYTWNRSEGIDWQYPQFDAATARSASRTAFSNGTLNPFVDTLAYPLDMSPYMSSASNAFGASVSTLADAGLRVSGPLGTLPGGRPNLTVGLGHREEKQPWGYRDTAAFGLTTYFPQAQRISSAYAEALVPLVGPGNAVPGVQLLDLQVASRFEDFSVSAGTAMRRTFPPDHAVDPNEVVVREKVDYSSTNTTVGLRYKPFRSLTLRASYATAFLPPGFSDLLPGVETLNANFGPDPRRGNEMVTATWLTGGNPDLDPTEARSWNAGLVYEPGFWEGARLGLEWFRIERSNLIFEPSFDLVIANEALYPGRVIRAEPAPGDPYGVGAIVLVDTSLVNAAHVVTEGIDFSVGYRRETDRYGVFNFDLLGTAVKGFTQQYAVGTPAVEIAGQVANDGPLKLRANATLGWELGNWNLGWTILHYGSYDQLDNPFYLAAQGGTAIPSQTYHNILVGYRFPDAGDGSSAAGLLSGASVTLGVRNLFNKVPPFDAYQSSIGYYSPFGDYRLRSVQLSIGKRF